MTRRETNRTTPKGHVGVVVWQPKHEVNVGTLWRSAFLYGASWIATIGKRYEKQASDTPNTPNKVPMFHFADIDDLHMHLPHGAPMVGVEMDDRAIPLNEFWHPPNAVYILGAEDHGLPDKVLNRCHRIVSIPTVEKWSMNMSVAGSIVLAHRHFQVMR